MSKSKSYFRDVPTEDVKVGQIIYTGHGEDYHVVSTHKDARVVGMPDSWSIAIKSNSTGQQFMITRFETASILFA